MARKLKVDGPSGYTLLLVDDSLEYLETTRLVLERAGHKVLVERGAGLGSGISDDEYRANGAEIIDAAADVFAQADLNVMAGGPGPILLEKDETTESDPEQAT